MCGIKPCAKCAQKKSIGKMAKRKKSIRRRRRMGAISKNEVSNAAMNTLYAIGGLLVANLVKKAITPATPPAKGDMMVYVPSAVATALGIVGAMSKNPSIRVMGYTAAATGGVGLLGAAGVDLPGMKGVRSIGLPRLGYNPTMGAVAATGTEEMVYG